LRQRKHYINEICLSDVSTMGCDGEDTILVTWVFLQIL